MKKGLNELFFLFKKDHSDLSNTHFDGRQKLKEAILTQKICNRGLISYSYFYFTRFLSPISVNGSKNNCNRQYTGAAGPSGPVITKKVWKKYFPR